MFSFLIIAVTFRALTADQVQSENPCKDRHCNYGTTCNANSTGTLAGCNCMQGYTGENCTDMDECKIGEIDPCRHKGYCVNAPGSYWCSCLESWTGPHCDKNLTNSVTCMPGYSGDKCNIALCEHGYAVNSTNETIPYTCHCHRGWDHDHDDDPCTKDIDECTLNSKLCNGGTCHNTNGSYICECIPPWEGENCTYYNSCLSNPCENGGICSKSGADADKNHECTCETGWQGFNCSDDVNECVSNLTGVCFNNGNCTNTPGSYTCMCDTGWTGTNCNEPTFPVTTEPTPIETTVQMSTTDIIDSTVDSNEVTSTEKDTPSTKMIPETDMPSTKMNIETDIPSTQMTTETDKASTKMAIYTQKKLAQTEEDKTPAIVGAAVGSIVAVVAVCVAAYFLYKRKRARVASRDKTVDTSRNGKIDAKRITKNEAIELPGNAGNC